MSKKTDAIYECLKKLDSYQQQLEEISNENDLNKVIDNINFGVKQELRTLRFWIDSLYKYNGKSRSILKKNASVANGKKGGRPPKEISNAKQRINLLENEIIPELDHFIVMADSNEELEKNKINREKARVELESCRALVFHWQQQKTAINKE